MWIEKTKSGKYKFAERYTDYMTGKQKRVSVTLEKNTAAAKKTAAKLLVQMIEQQQNETSQKTDLTLAELIDKYKSYQKNAVKASTYQRNLFACDTLKKMLGADILVDRLTANYIKECFIHSGKSNSTLNEYRKRLLALLRWAFENDYLKDDSFLRKFKPFKESNRKAKVQDKYLEPAELKQLLNCMTSDKWRLFTEFLVLSGLRIGEAVALNKCDIDFETHVIHVFKNYDVINKLVTTPKTSCSIRDVYMQPELEKLCKAINLQIKLEALTCGYRTNLFFPNSKGGYLNYYSYNKYLRENSEKHLKHQITAHALRHTHASILLANGVNIDTIARRLGHENSAITREIYLHVTEKLVENDNLQIQGIKIV